MSQPTIVLVHGAFADASIWRSVYDHLARDGHTVLAPPNPLRGIPHDASYTQSVIDRVGTASARNDREVRPRNAAPVRGHFLTTARAGREGYRAIAAS
jgi:hypothetical protein